MSNAMIALSIAIATIGAGLMAGVFFVFSAFIMASFNWRRRLKPTSIQANSGLVTTDAGLDRITSGRRVRWWPAYWESIC